MRMATKYSSGADNSRSSIQPLYSKLSGDSLHECITNLENAIFVRIRMIIHSSVVGSSKFYDTFIYIIELALIFFVDNY